MKTRTLIIVGIIAAITVSAISIIFAYNQEIKLATGTIGYDKQEPESIPTEHPINTYKGKDCRPSESLNKTCFTDAFTNCKNAKIAQTRTTIEGDPITTFAFVNNTNPSKCKIDIYHDTTQDRYSNQIIYHYRCSLIIDSGKPLQIAKCVPLEHGESQRFEFE